MGDSLTQQGGSTDSQGWSARLQQSYIRSVDVLNRGLSGWNTKMFREQALPVISQELQFDFAPALMTLWFGANDAALPTGPSAHQRVPVDEYRDNLIHILTQFRTLAPQAKIVLISPPVVDDDTRQTIQGANNPLDRSNAQAGVYAAACQNASQAVDGATFLDMYGYLNTTYPTATDRQNILIDGLHFNTEGNRVVWEKINQQIRALLPSSLIDKSQI